MLEKPNLPDELIVSCLGTDFELNVSGVRFLPLGADVDTAVYRADGGEVGPYFVKLRRGDDAGIAIEIARLLSDLGIEQVIPPFQTSDGRLWAQLGEFTVSVTPFVTGEDGFNLRLSDDNWITLGAALTRIHAAELPASLQSKLPVENFSAHWRDLVRTFQALVESGPFPDEAAERLGALMRRRREVIADLVERTEQLCDQLKERSPEMVPCHADIHAGNVLIDPHGRLYIVDWDTFMLAPKERDLMFIGGGIGSDWQGERPERLFYQGYGPAEIDLTTIAYYRCERIIQDFAEFGKQIFLTDEGGADREQALHYFASNFEPGSTLDIALDSERQAREHPAIRYDP